MSEFEGHTPGPWITRVSRDGSGDVGITADGLPNVLAEAFGDIRRFGERAFAEAAANARLIAAAPDLLRQRDEARAEAERLREALTKAERALRDAGGALFDGDTVARMRPARGGEGMNELLPCPFCGGEDAPHKAPGLRRTWHIAHLCGGGLVHFIADSREEVVAAWNHRAPQSEGAS